MSRYTIQLDENTQFVYGYDRPLLEYFFQYFDENKELIRDGAGTQSTLLDEFHEVGIDRIPSEHVNDVALDLPIGLENNQWVQ